MAMGANVITSHIENPKIAQIFSKHFLRRKDVKRSRFGRFLTFLTFSHIMVNMFAPNYEYSRSKLVLSPSYGKMTNPTEPEHVKTSDWARWKDN